MNPEEIHDFLLMNMLVISTKPRLFMAVVGPSGCGKTFLIYNLLKKGVYEPQFDKIFYFYQHYQPIYDEMKKVVPNIEFVGCVDFDMIADLKNDGTNYLLIFDDSCAEIYESKEFEKLATSGRHLKLNVIYVKHNLFQQSKYSRTIDLNNTHIVLFKNPRDYVQQKVLFSKMGQCKYLTECYEVATQGNKANNAWGHLFIDCLPRTNDLLRIAHNIGGENNEPARFFEPESKSRIHIFDDEYTTSMYSTALERFQQKATGCTY